MTTDPIETQEPEKPDVTQAVAVEPEADASEDMAPEGSETPAEPEDVESAQTPAAPETAEPTLEPDAEQVAAEAAEVPAEPEAEQVDQAAEPEAEQVEVPAEPEAEQAAEPQEQAATAEAPAIEAATEAAAQAPVPQAPKWPVPVWPFLLYDLVWLAGAGVLVWQLIETPDGTAVYDAPAYAIAIYGAIGLAATGPILALIVWLASRRRMKVAGALGSSVLRASAATALGMVIWWAALVLVDYMRLGRVF